VAEVWLGTQHLLARGEEQAAGVLDAARRAGVTWLDTADVYGAGAVERFVAVRADGLRLATKVGLVAQGARYVPDGRADALARAIDASRARLPRIDRLWWHAPDPRVDLRRSAAPLRRAVEQGLVGELGVCNVRVGQLRALADLLPLAAVQLEVSRGERAVVRGGALEEADRLGLPVVAYRPFGGRDRARRTLADPAVARVAARHGVPAAAVVLAWLADLRLVPLPATTDPAHLAEWRVPVTLDDEDRAALDAGTEVGAQRRRPRAERRPPAGRPGGGAGGRHAGRGQDDPRPGAAGPRAPQPRRAGGHARRPVAPAGGGARRRPRRGPRQHVPHAGPAQRGHRDGVAPRRAGALRVAGHAGRRGGAQRGAPAARHRGPPGGGRGAGGVERAGRGGVAPAGAATGSARSWSRPRWTRASSGWTWCRSRARRARAARACCVRRSTCGGPTRRWSRRRRRGWWCWWRGWSPDADPAAAAAALEAEGAAAGLRVAAAVCPHGAGPPVCWCRKPLPGLLLALARREGVDPTRVKVLAASAADRTLARRLSLSLA
jgi:aryl-alcohol dehydrogenase-like predicted oxidoreductase